MCVGAHVIFCTPPPMKILDPPLLNIELICSFKSSLIPTLKTMKITGCVENKHLGNSLQTTQFYFQIKMMCTFRSVSHVCINVYEYKHWTFDYNTQLNFNVKRVEFHILNQWKNYSLSFNLLPLKLSKNIFIWSFEAIYQHYKLL